MVILGGARARFVLRAFAERVLGVRFAVEGVAGATEDLLDVWFRR